MTMGELPYGTKHQPMSPCVLGLSSDRVIGSAGPTIYLNIVYKNTQGGGDGFDFQPGSINRRVFGIFLGYEQNALISDKR